MVDHSCADHIQVNIHQIQQPPNRYRVIDLPKLFGLCGFSKLADFQQAHRQWVEIALRDELSARDARWSEAVAVGGLAFAEKIRSDLETKAMHREVGQEDGTHALRNRARLTGANLPSNER